MCGFILKAILAFWGSDTLNILAFDWIELTNARKSEESEVTKL